MTSRFFGRGLVLFGALALCASIIGGRRASAGFREAGLGARSFSRWRSTALNPEEPAVSRRAVLQTIARAGGAEARASLERIGTYDPLAGPVDYEIKREALRLLARLGRPKSLPAVSEPHLKELLARARAEAKLFIFDWDGTLVQNGDKRTTPWAEDSLEALTADSKTVAILSGRSLVSPEPRFAMLPHFAHWPNPLKRKLIWATDNGAKIHGFDDNGRPRLIRVEPGWNRIEREVIARETEPLKARYGAKPGEFFVDHHYTLFLPQSIPPLELRSAAASLRKALARIGRKVRVSAQVPPDGSPAYISFSRFDKSLGMGLLRRMSPCGLALAVGDQFFGEKAGDSPMAEAARTWAFAIGGSADPRLNDVFVLPRTGVVAIREIARALTADF